MNSTLRGLAAEITPEWLKPKSTDAKDNPAPRDKTEPKPAHRWQPEVEKTPLDPKEEADSFDKDRGDIDKSDPRHGFTPKPK